MSKNNRHDIFLKELTELLKKHNVEIECKDYWQGYFECGEDVRMTAMFAGDYSDPYNTIAYSDLDLGSWITGDTKYD